MQAQEYLRSRINEVVVVLTPDTATSTELMGIAAGLSRLCEASVNLAYLYDLPPPPAAVTPPGAALNLLPQQAYEDIQTEAERRLRDALSTMSGLGVSAGGKALGTFGGFDPLLDWIAESNCDLVVMPERVGRGRTWTLRKGMTTTIVENVNCPVVVVRVQGNGASRVRHSHLNGTSTRSEPGLRSAPGVSSQ